LASVESAWPALVNGIVGVAGMLFAARLTLEEIDAHAHYRLGLPTCAYGLVFFVALVVLSLACLMAARAPTPTDHPLRS
jgi:hypothetical protein